MKATTTLAKTFAEYARYRVNKNAPDELREFTQDTFFAGAGVVLELMEMVERRFDSPEQRNAVMKRVRDEWRAYSRDYMVRQLFRMLGVDRIVVTKVSIEHGPASCEASIGCIDGSSGLSLGDWKSPNTQPSRNPAG